MSPTCKYIQSVFHMSKLNMKSQNSKLPLRVIMFLPIKILFIMNNYLQT